MRNPSMTEFGFGPYGLAIGEGVGVTVHGVGVYVAGDGVEDIEEFDGEPLPLP
jgi:hypothetical protein